MQPYQVYDCRGVRVSVIVAQSPFHALNIAIERGIFRPMVDWSPIRR